MRISGQEKISRNNISIRQGHLNPVRPPSGAAPAEDALSGRLARIFRDKGLNIPPSQIATLGAEISALDMATSEIDSETALRALLLLHHKIPLTRELLAGAWNHEDSIFKSIAVLQKQALSLLGGKNIGSEKVKYITIGTPPTFAWSMI